MIDNKILKMIACVSTVLCYETQGAEFNNPIEGLKISNLQKIAEEKPQALEHIKQVSDLANQILQDRGKYLKDKWTLNSCSFNSAELRRGRNLPNEEKQHRAKVIADSWNKYLESENLEPKTIETQEEIDILVAQTEKKDLNKAKKAFIKYNPDKEGLQYLADLYNLKKETFNTESTNKKIEVIKEIFEKVERISYLPTDDSASPQIDPITAEAIKAAAIVCKKINFAKNQKYLSHEYEKYLSHEYSLKEKIEKIIKKRDLNEYYIDPETSKALSSAQEFLNRAWKSEWEHLSSAQEFLNRARKSGNSTAQPSFEKFLKKEKSKSKKTDFEIEIKMRERKAEMEAITNTGKINQEESKSQETDLEAKISISRSKAKSSTFKEDLTNTGEINLK